MSNLRISLIGAGGKMGTRISNNLMKYDYHLSFCENNPLAVTDIEKKGYDVSEIENAVPGSDLIIMAVPDVLLGPISEEIVPLMKQDATMLFLDPASAYAGELTLRQDCTFVVTHPCHPGLFTEQETPEAKADIFGGVAAKQDIVVALLMGKEHNFLRAMEISKQIFAPVVNAHRITVEQMASLEPALAEVVAITAISVLKEALDTVVNNGVPEEAAKAFLLGHINIAFGVFFKSTNPLSDAAKIAINYGYHKVFKEDWKDVFNKESITEVIQLMLHPKP